jgi:hypothetical protein
MPEYLYKDSKGHIDSLSHRMLYSTAVTCPECGAAMWRIPQLPNVNWGALRPSQGELSPAAKDLIYNRDKRVEETEQKWAHRDESTDRHLYGKKSL